MPRLHSAAFSADGAPLTFTLDGREFPAIEGETIAAALMAAGHRSFKRDRDGRSRGLSCGMGVCFECELSVDGGPPVRACMTKACAGMQLTSLAYRKAPPVQPVAPAAEREIVDTEVLIVGAGPAGLVAALALDAAGVDVVLVDERGAPGGQFYKPLADSQRFSTDDAVDAQYRDGLDLTAKLRASSVRLLQESTAWGAFRAADGALEAGVVAAKRAWLVNCAAMVLAAGAFESIPAFPGWTLPGVMTTGAAQGLARAYRVSPGENVLIAGNGPLNLQLACELLAGGARVLAVAESAPDPFPTRVLHGVGLLTSDPGLALRGLRYLATLRRHGVPVLWGHHVARAEGSDAVASVTLAKLDAGGHLQPGTERRFDVDALCLGYGLQPSNELARALGCRHEAVTPGVLAPVRDGRGETTVPGVFVAGDGGVLGGAQVAKAEGQLVAAAVLARLRRTPVENGTRNGRLLRRQRRFQRHLWSFYEAPQYVPRDDETLLCRCENVSLGAIRALLRTGLTDFGSIKRCTRAGMGSCQGRYCQRQLAAVVADLTGVTPAAEQLFDARLPVKPVPIALLAEEKPDWEGYRTIEGGFAPPARPAATARESIEAEVAIIGAGIIGISAAMHLAEAGVDVLVIDRDTPFAQASGTNAGSLHGQMLSSDFGRHRDRDSAAAHAIKLQRLGIDEWQTLEARLDADFEMQLSGGLVVASREEELAYLERKVRLEQHFGLDVEILDRAALQALLPAVSGAMAGAAFCRSEGKINPLAVGPALLAAADRAGVRRLVPAAVHAIRQVRGGFEVEAGSARVRCGQLVNAAGGWAAGVAGLLGARLPVRTAPQQMIVTEPVEPLVPMLVAAAGRHLTLKQVANGNVIIGGGWPADYDRERGRPVNLRESIEGNLWVARHVIPSLGSLRMLRSWATVGVMIDGAPIIGEYPGVRGFYNGVGANGYTMGPLIGRILANLVRGEAPPLDITPFLVERFR